MPSSDQRLLRATLNITTLMAVDTGVMCYHPTKSGRKLKSKKFFSKNVPYQMQTTTTNRPSYLERIRMSSRQPSPTQQLPIRTRHTLDSGVSGWWMTIYISMSSELMEVGFRVGSVFLDARVRIMVDGGFA
jgi:hypothetical protein